LPSNGSKYWSSNSCCGPKHKATKLFHFFCVSWKLVGKNLVKTNTKGPSKDHVPHYRNLIHNLFHRTGENSSFWEIFEEVRNSCVFIH
jgi:hypothetical protein